MTFAAGDVVILKSGGQPMTVITVDENQAECIWAGDEGNLFRETIPTVALEEVEFEIDDADSEEDDDEEMDEEQRENVLSPA